MIATGNCAVLDLGLPEQQLKNCGAGASDLWINGPLQDDRLAYFLGTPHTKDRLGAFLFREQKKPPLLALRATVVAFLTRLKVFPGELKHFALEVLRIPRCCLLHPLP
jgi:hypothetical protein